jgi:hypothetical protein
MDKENATENPMPDPLTESFVELVDGLEICDPGLISGRNQNVRRYFGHLSRWFYGEDQKQHRNYIGRQYNGHNKVRPMHTVFLEMMAILEREGYDLSSVEIGEDGRIKKLNHENPDKSIGLKG